MSDRLMELAQLGARANHEAAHAFSWLTPERNMLGHVTVVFKDCPHSDCVLVRQLTSAPVGSPRPQERWTMHAAHGGNVDARSASGVVLDAELHEWYYAPKHAVEPAHPCVGDLEFGPGIATGSQVD